MTATNQTARPAIPPGLVSGGIVAIGRHIDAESATLIAAALADGGVRAFELTLNEPESGALGAIEAVARVAPDLGLEIGAGTILSIEAAERAIAAGATFLVMPHLDVDLVRWAAASGIPAFPGCGTPTEVLAAWRAGAAAVKVFPASVLGPAFIRELRGPFPEIPVVPTGGVTLESAQAFVAAGAIAVGMGSWLLGGGASDRARIGLRGRQIVAAVAAARLETHG